MSDYAEQLGALRKAKYPDFSEDLDMHDITDGMSWMADRIKALEAERDALAEKLAATNEKLKHIVDEYDSLPWGPVIRAIAPARATLAQITGEDR